jgi:3-oxoacyl-[acyl-carrier-protein] synthase II
VHGGSQRVRRVAVTGIGLVTSLGLGAPETWSALLAGRSGVGPVRGFDASSLGTRLAAEILDFDAKPYVSNRRALRMMTRNDQLAVVAAALAVKDAGLTLPGERPERAGLFVGGNKETSKPESLLEGVLVARGDDGVADVKRLGAEARSSFPPLFFVEGLQAASLFYVSEAHGLKGANTYFAGTAEAGAIAVGRAFRAIRRGEADVALCGGFDDAASWWTLSKYDAMGFMTRSNDLGPRACRPFDRARAGTVLGDGAALLVLEELDAARARGARIHAEITGLGQAYDGQALLTPDPEGRVLARAMEGAIRDAGTTISQVDYVAAHGSGTRLGDASEARALRAVFGRGADKPAASSVKPSTGHLMAAAGALNVAVAALALKHQVLPPTLNLDDMDPACDLNWVRSTPREARVEQALAVARGLGGQEIAIALRADGTS